jgi:hypothetical protein
MRKRDWTSEGNKKNEKQTERNRKKTEKNHEQDTETTKEKGYKH